MLPTYSCVSERQQFLQTLPAGKTRSPEAQQQVSASVYAVWTATKTASSPSDSAVVCKQPQDYTSWQRWDKLPTSFQWETQAKLHITPSLWWLVFFFPKQHDPLCIKEWAVWSRVMIFGLKSTSVSRKCCWCQNIILNSELSKQGSTGRLTFKSVSIW